MRSLRLLQGLVLACILMIPILIILFLKSFSSNEYIIPVLFEEGVEDPFEACEMVYGEQHYIPEFELTSHQQQNIGREEMSGKITIVDFFFTSCPSICPIMSTEMERVDDAFRNDENVQIFSISIDPEYDTPEVLSNYAEMHRATPDKWYFLTGDKSEIYNLARCGFILPVADGYDDPEDFIHSDKFILVDDLGRIRGYYSGTDRDDVDKLILETKVLLHGKKQHLN